MPNEPKEIEDISFDMRVKNYNKIRRFLTQVPQDQINNNIKISKHTTLGGGDALQTPLQIACSKYVELGSDLGLIKSLMLTLELTIVELPFP